MKIRIKLPLKTRILIKIHTLHVCLIRLISGWNRPMIFNWKFPPGVGLEIGKENEHCYISRCFF